MPGRDAQWVIGTIVAAVIALSVQTGGIRSDLAEIRADMRDVVGAWGVHAAEGPSGGQSCLRGHRAGPGRPVMRPV